MTIARIRRSVAVAAAAMASVSCSAPPAAPAAAGPPPGDSIVAASLAAGYFATFLCSSTYLAGRSVDEILQNELAEGPNLLTTTGEQVRRIRPKRTGLDAATRSAWAEPVHQDHPLFAGEPRRAVFREGLGCSLLPPGAPLSAAPLLPHLENWAPPADLATRAWPDGDAGPPLALPAGVDSAALGEAIEAAFTGERYRPHRTLGVVIVHRGQIIAERYEPGWTMHTQYRTWSTGKSIANALVGMMVGRGELRVLDPAPLPEWQHPLDPRRRITIEHLLQMSSGLESTGGITPLGYWGGIDVGQEALSAPLERPPGSRWQYSNYDTVLLLRAIREVLANDAEYLALPRTLFDRIGMFHTFAETDAFGNFIISSQVFTTARDLARFALLYLNDGMWNGERILPEGWVAYSVKPAASRERYLRENAGGNRWGYGAQWWLLGGDAGTPAGAYTTNGSRGQFATIVPTHDLIVVRTGLDAGGSGWKQAQFVAEIVRAVAPAQPVP